MGWKIPAVGDRFPFSVTLVAAVLVVLGLAVVALILYLPRHKHAVRTKTEISSSVRQPAPKPSKGPDLSEVMAEARKFIKTGNLDAAQSLLDRANELSPHDSDVVELTNEIKLEKENKNLLEQAQKLISSGKKDGAIDVLLRIPKSSIFHQSASARLQQIRQDFSDKFKKKCRRKSRNSLQCRRLKALISKIDSALISSAQTQPAKDHKNVTTPANMKASTRSNTPP
jgi:hypothetical protein